MNNRYFPVLMAIIMSMFHGCGAHTPTLPFGYNQELHSALHLSEDLEKRIQHYWTARSQGALKDAYDMEAPYTRELTPFSIYEGIFSKANPVAKLEILDIDSPTDRYHEIRLKLFIHKNQDQTRETVILDRWVLAEDTWFHVIKDPVMKNYFP